MQKVGCSFMFCRQSNKKHYFCQEIIYCDTHKYYNIQYFVFPPFFSITIFRRLDILSMSLQQYLEVMSRVETTFITFSRCLRLLGCCSDTLFCKTIHKCSIRFKSGLLPSQSRTRIFLLFKKLVTIFDL